jgi:hypothetical protein
MAFKINETDVITDQRNLNNILDIDDISSRAIVRSVSLKTTLLPGNTIGAIDPREMYVDSGYPNTRRTIFGFIQKGEVTFQFQARKNHTIPPAQVFIRRIREGVISTVFTQDINNLEYNTFSSIQSVLPGDIFEIYQSINTSNSNRFLYTKDVSVRTNINTTYIPIVYTYIFENIPPPPPPPPPDYGP